MATIEAYPYRVRASWGDQLLAESESCLSVEQEGAPSMLYFPQGDIDLSLFTETTGASSSNVGEVELRSIETGGADADGVVAIVVNPAPGFEALAGHGQFDCKRVQVEVLDAPPGTEARDITVKGFPTWGDAAHLIDLLDVRPSGAQTFVSVARSDGRRPVVEGSQMLGQAMVAAGRHAPGRRVVSASMQFLKPADAREPLLFTLDELSAGRMFVCLAVQVTQNGRCCAAGTLLLDATAPDVIRHEADRPEVPGPYDSPPYDMNVTGRDVRVVGGSYTNDPDAPAGPPVIDAWVRFREVPDDPLLHAGLLAQFTGHMSIAAALRPHQGVSQDQAHRTLSMAINGINLSLHREVRADQWMLYHHHSTFAGDGMTHSECRVYTEDGDLIASFTVDAMVRSFAGGRTHDERTAL
jgi:acyl-CoA thioesterase/uncharacterized protein (DUF427 family)